MRCNASESPELPPIDYYLVITDSIGIETGDSNYVLPWPICVTHSPDGSIVVLDRLKHAVFFYSPEGEFIRSVGREGEGPGEFHRPGIIKFYSNGCFLVSHRGGISVFDSSFEYEDKMTWLLFKPFIVAALDDGGFIAVHVTYERQEQKMAMTYTLGRWDGEGDPSIEYFTTKSDWFTFNGVIDHTRNREQTIYSCATHDGRIFYSQSSIDRFEIHGCEVNGTPFFHVEDGTFRRVSKSEDELQAEMDYITSYFNRMTGGQPIGIEIKLDPYKQAILDMFLDGEERLWVKLGFYPGIVFRVYDMSGEILFHAMLDYPGDPLDLLEWTVTGDEHGFLAYNPHMEDYARVYMLTLVETN